MPKLFIQTFEKIVVEYFEKVATINLSAEVYTKSYSANIICIGLNTIIHIFRITLSKYKNTEISHHYCKHGFLYYLEYIQQIFTSDLQTGLNINDAIAFVYSKTLADLSVTMPSVDSISPNIELNNSITIMKNLANIVNGILLWKHDLSIETRCVIIKSHLSKYLTLFTESNMEKIINYLPKLVDVNHLAYFYKHAKRIGKSNANLLDSEINHKLIIDYIIEST